MTDYADWTVPQANADSIAATGVPLLGAPNALLNAAPNVLPSTPYISANLPISQLGYEVAIRPAQSGAGAAAPLMVEFTWLDSSATIAVASETWWVWPGVTTGDHIIYGKGPTKGSFLQVAIQNTSGTMTYSVPIQIWQRSHPYTRDDWRSRVYTTTASGVSVTNSDLSVSLIGYRLATIAAAGIDNTDLPLYSGPCFLYGQTASGAADMLLTVQSSADATAPAIGSKFFQFTTAANGIFSQQIVLPRYQCRVQLKNNNAAAQACYYSLYALEQSA
jgi:hypothetical protein